MGREKSRVLIVAVTAILLVVSLVFLRERSVSSKQYHAGPSGKTKLYWLIPDGLRADPDLFQIFRWAEEGKMPNLKRMMDQGSYGYSIPVFPSHTPVNYASLFTGTNPLRHGVADGPMRLAGYPLNMISLSGFHSTAKNIDPVWTVLESAGLSSTLFSVPGSTPPETRNSQVIRGRWGNWGIEFPSQVFHSLGDEWLKSEIGWSDRVFGVEKTLTEFAAAKEPSGWELSPRVTHSPLREVSLKAWGADLYLLLSDSTDDGKENYDTATVSLDKKTVLSTLREGESSEWFPLRLVYQTARQYQKDAPARLGIEEKISGVGFDTPVKLRLIQLGKKDMFRVRALYGALNESVAVPSSLAGELTKRLGPMVDFADNYPPQLIYYPGDRAAFLEEAGLSFDWHRKAAALFLGELSRDVLIHSLYTPNQMLTSRWWMGAVDPASRHYEQTPLADREQAWKEVHEMYAHIDDLLGDAMKSMGPDSLLVLSSDHGVAPLNEEVRLNNLFAKKGWLSFAFDPRSGRQEIDWRKTKVAYLNMNHVYVNPNGLAGPYHPATGPAFRALREEVRVALANLRNDKGDSALAASLPREEAATWGLPGDRVGDLLLANNPGFSWAEEVSPDLKVFVNTFKAGYKQAILPEKNKALWTPFVIMGPGVKKGHAISRPISHLDQYPTLLRLLNVKSPYKPDGEPLVEIFQQ
jgi:predicted AlkP superfamily phosphohydrolase/phosphomutase